jgi:hypothetical protein
MSISLLTYVAQGGSRDEESNAISSNHSASAACWRGIVYYLSSYSMGEVGMNNKICFYVQYNRKKYKIIKAKPIVYTIALLALYGLCDLVYLAYTKIF